MMTTMFLLLYSLWYVIFEGETQNLGKANIVFWLPNGCVKALRVHTRFHLIDASLLSYIFKAQENL